jgi:Txe/YoeB family toxin of Txe-Axe toxin-antitoxin module
MRYHSSVDFEAGSEQILDLILGQGKEYARMDRELLKRFERVLSLIATVDSLDALRSFRSLDLKFFDGHYQARVDGEKRLWFEVTDEQVIIVFFGSTDHRHGKIR